MFGFFKKFDRQKKLAENGNPIAQYNLGCCYVNGDGVPQDLAEAAKWFRLAADQGIAEAEYRLGLWLLHQSVMPPGVAAMGADRLEKEAELKAEAAKWFRLAADQGYAPAQFQLGEYYEHGCVSRTSDKRLGFSYNDGRVTRNLVEAYKWYNLASAQGYVDGIIQRPATTYRDAVATEMTPDQIAEAEKLTREFKPQKKSAFGISSSP
jgi:TPR repeat protein